MSVMSDDGSIDEIDDNRSLIAQENITKFSNVLD